MLSSASSNELPIPTPIELDNVGTVLFDLPAERLPSIVGDLRRLGGQPLRILFCPTADDEPGRVLLRAASHPQLVVERVIDGSFANQPEQCAIAYSEHRAGIWVQIGFRHPRPESHQPEAGKLVLLKGNGEVEIVADDEFTTELSELPLAEISNRYIASR